MVLTKEKYKDGHHIVDGIFRAIKKDKEPNPPKDISPKYFYSTNKDMKYFNGKNNTNNQSKECATIKIIFLVIIIFILFFLLLDYYNVYRKILKDNEIERDRCKKEYKENKCNQITIDDGPIINDYCMERKKCIRDNVVCFHEVLIRYAKNIIFVILKGSTIKNVFIFLVTVLIIFRIIK